MSKMTPIVKSLVVMLCLFSCSTLLQAQDEDAETEEAPSKKTPKTSKEDSSHIVIQREPLLIINQRTYQIPLYLEPVQKVQITAPVTSTILKLEVKSGEMVKKNDQLVQLENFIQRLELDKVTASREMAEVQLRIAQKLKDDDQIQLATARVAYSKADLELAKYRLNQTSVRAPFSGRIFRVESSLGQQVQRGWTMMTIGDVSQLTVEIPVDRNKVKEGGTLKIGIEDQSVSVVIHAILPLSERFAPIRELVDSAASAYVILKNTGQKYQPGQTVFVPIIPRHPVAEVANSCISNASGGKKKVQVIRENYVTDVDVDVFGPVGATRSYISGLFINGDKIITNSSKSLADGTHIRPLTDTAPTSSGKRKSDKTRNKPRVGF
jgi:RND family efflux transporter MFP subunit